MVKPIIFYTFFIIFNPYLITITGEKTFIEDGSKQKIHELKISVRYFYYS